MAETMTINRELLEKPFAESQIKKRRGRDGGQWDYVETASVTQRLNEAFDGSWSFEIIYEKVMEHSDEVIVKGRLIAGGVFKEQYGSKDIMRKKGTGDIVCLGDDMKAAASDALKKCATQFGVALHLYMDDVVPAAGSAKQRQNVENNGSDQDRLRKKTFALAAETGVPKTEYANTLRTQFKVKSRADMTTEQWREAVHDIQIALILKLTAQISANTDKPVELGDLSEFTEKQLDKTVFKFKTMAEDTNKQSVQEEPPPNNTKLNVLVTLLAKRMAVDEVKLGEWMATAYENLDDAEKDLSGALANGGKLKAFRDKFMASLETNALDNLGNGERQVAEMAGART